MVVVQTALGGLKLQYRKSWYLNIRTISELLSRSFGLACAEKLRRRRHSIGARVENDGRG
jgi:hypothetical protein